MGFNSGFKGLSSSLCSFLHSPVTSSLLGPNILFQRPILKHPQPFYKWNSVVKLRNNQFPFIVDLLVTRHCISEACRSIHQRGWGSRTPVRSTCSPSASPDKTSATCLVFQWYGLITRGHSVHVQWARHTYLLTPWSRVLLEKLTSKLCS